MLLYYIFRFHLNYHKIDRYKVNSKAACNMRQNIIKIAQIAHACFVLVFVF